MITNKAKRAIFYTSNFFFFLISIFISFSVFWGSDFYFINKRDLLIGTGIAAVSLFYSQDVFDVKSRIKKEKDTIWKFFLDIIFIFAILGLFFFRFADKFSDDKISFIFILFLFPVFIFTFYVYFQSEI